MTLEENGVGSNPLPVTRMHVPWTLKDMAWALVATVMFSVLGVMVAGLVAGAILLIGRGGLALERYMALVMVLVLSSEGLLLVPSWVWGPAKYGGGWRALGLRRGKPWTALALMALAVVVIIGVNVLWELLRERLGWPDQADLSQFLGDGLGSFLLAVLMGGVLAPLAEEVFFRGYIYAGLRARWGVSWGLVASSLLFACAHLSPATIPPLFVMGLLLAYVYERSDSLWPSIILHMLNNTAAFIIVYVAA